MSPCVDSPHTWQGNSILLHRLSFCTSDKSHLNTSHLKPWAFPSYQTGSQARNVLPELIAAEGGIKLTREEPAWPAFKSETHFGQLPFLKHGDVKVSQSGAIMRYLAKKTNLQGQTDADFVMSEMLTEEYGDVLNGLGKCQYPPTGAAGRPAAYTAYFGEDGAARKHLGNIEKLVTASGGFTSTRTMGELAVVGICVLYTDLEPACLAPFPKLAAFYAAHEANAKKALDGLSGYYSRSDKEEQ